jgi:4-hydroxybenzoate polyprenyltransferase
LLGGISAVILLNVTGFNIWLNLSVAFIACSLIASGNYGINEVFDTEDDRHHPQKNNRPLPAGRLKAGQVLFISAILYVIGFAVSILLKRYLVTILLFLYFTNALFYNLKPLRLKDKPYIDFISEALNNPLRFLIGWYTVAGVDKIFPASFIFALWFFGIFLMSAKRFGEFRLIKDKRELESYRKSMVYYTEEKLLFTMISALSAAYYMLGAFCMKHSVDLLIALPFIIIWTIWFFHLAYEENTIVKDPERIFEKLPFLIFSTFGIALFIYMFLTKNNIMEWVKQKPN